MDWPDQGPTASTDPEFELLGFVRDLDRMEWLVLRRNMETTSKSGTVEVVRDFVSCEFRFVARLAEMHEDDVTQLGMTQVGQQLTCCTV